MSDLNFEMRFSQEIYNTDFEMRFPQEFCF